MLRFQFWKILLIFSVLSIGAVYSLPNIFPPDPAVQITFNSAGGNFNEKIVDSIKEVAKKSNLNFISTEADSKSILFRAKNYEDQVRLKDFFQEKLDNNFAEDAFDTSPKLKTDLQKELRYFLHFGKSFFLPP